MTIASTVDSLIREGLSNSVELQPLRPEDVPLQPLFWNVMVEPLIPKKQTASGILIADESLRVEKIQNTIGRVLHVGALAFKGKSASGLELQNDPLAHDLKAGDYVLFARYTGQTITLKANAGEDRQVIILSDSELLAIVRDPEQIRFWI